MSLKTLDHSETLAFHPWIGSNPTEVLDQLKVSAFRWNLMSTITTIAIGAISFSVVFASFFWAIPMPIMIVGGGILPTVLSFATSYFREQALEIEASIENGEAVALEFSKILSWNETQVLSFLKENNIPKPKEISLSDLLPLIARYVARCKQAEEYAIKSQELLASDKTTDREARLWQRIEGWRFREECVLPARIEAAFILEILRNPTMTGFPSDHFIFYKKPFAERILCRSYDNEDLYLEFRNQSHKPLNFEDLNKISDPKSVHKLLYG